MKTTIFKSGWRVALEALDWSRTVFITLTCPYKRWSSENQKLKNIEIVNIQDAGYYVLAKFVDDEKTEIHITAYKVSTYFVALIPANKFQVPEQNTIFTPGGVLHTNNYQKGTWRIMLSEGPVEEMKLKRGGTSFGFIIG